MTSLDSFSLPKSISNPPNSLVRRMSRASQILNSVTVELFQIKSFSRAPMLYFRNMIIALMTSSGASVTAEFTVLGKIM